MPVLRLTIDKSSDVQPSVPIDAAFYYPWYPEVWSWPPYGFPFTNYTPSLGFYDSGSLRIAQRHVASMLYAGLDAAIASWHRPGDPHNTDSRLGLLLEASRDTPFRWAAYYEDEGYADPPANVIENDIAYLRHNYFDHESYLRIDNRPVLFVYGDAEDGCEAADRWGSADIGSVLVVLRVVPGYDLCQSQPDGWHEYAAGSRITVVPGQAISISPGYWFYLGTPLLTEIHMNGNKLSSR